MNELVGHLVVSAHSVATIAMFGIIWFVQVIHYPGLDLPTMTGREYGANARRTGWVVGPIMVVEAGSALALLWLAPHLRMVVLFAMIVVLWALTFLVSAPLHRRLISGGYERATVERLIRTNWPRTALWTIRAVAVATASPSV